MPVLGLALLLSGLAVCAPAQAPRPKAISMAALFDAIALEDYPEARRQADALLPKSQPAEALKISLAYGRILLGLKLKEQARQYLVLMSRQKLEGDAPTLMAVYAAWLEALDDKPDSAIKNLEAILKKEARDMATAEAADVLAMLHMGTARGAGFQPADRQQSLKQAKRAVDFGLATIKYADLKTDYTETLLLRRLKSHIASPEAEQQYHAADKLRQKKKVAEAGKAFHELCQKFPDSEWAAPAMFRIGQCYLGLDHPKQALGHWQKFIEVDPEGPCRGQSHVAIIDLALKQNLDLKMASKHALAATSVVVSLRETKPLAEREAYTSWQQASHDIHLRHGIVSLTERRYEAAARAFRAAEASLESVDRRPKDDSNLKPTAYSLQSLARLAEAADQRLPLLPRELMADEAKTVIALSLGNIYCILNDFQTAERFFNIPLEGKWRTHSAAHRSFALFGLAGALGNLPLGGESRAARYEKIKSLYTESWDVYRLATWHDETLFRMATIIEDLANFRHAAKKPAEDRKVVPAGEQLTAPARESQVKAENARRDARVKDRRESLSYWEHIVKRFPDSPRCEQALYHIGLVQYETAAAASGKDALRKWKEAAASFSRLCDKYPKSTYAGDAYVRQIDIALERFFDLPQTIALVEQGIAWAKEQKVEVVTTAEGKATPEAIAAAARAIKEGSRELPSWSQMGQRQGAALLADLYNLYLRAGIIAYVDGQYDQAVEYLNAAGPARPTDGMEGNFELHKVGLYILKNSCQRKQPAWYELAVKEAKTDQEKLALRLADTYLHAQRPEKAQAIYEQLLSQAPRSGANKAVESYCLMQMALAYSNQRVNYAQSIACYQRFYQKEYADQPWAADAIIRLAVLEYNVTGDPRRSIAHYRHIIAHYPEHPDAERALYFMAIDALQLGDRALAESSCRAFLEKYPRSGWRSHVQTILGERIQKRATKKEQN